MEYVVSEAAERNKGPILQVLRQELATSRRVLEIGSGTGQHALFFSTALPALTWQPTDMGDYLPALRERLRHDSRPNLLPVMELDVNASPWPVETVDAVYSSNTLHIMGWSGVEAFFRGVGRVLGPHGVVCVYGPFRYAGSYTSDSNRQFDEFLRRRDPDSGIRDFEALDALAREAGLTFSANHPLPANNQLLVWRR